MYPHDEIDVFFKFYKGSTVKIFVEKKDFFDKEH